MSTLPTTFTRHYQKWREGDSDAQEKLILLVRQEMRRIARQLLRQERDSALLETDMLVDDAVLLLLGKPGKGWNNRRHFLIIAGCQMRHLLIDHARSNKAQKRLAYPNLIPLDDVNDILDQQTPDLDALNEALQEFQKIDERASQIIDLRFFSGLTEAEVAAVLAIPLSAVKNDWKMAKLWLHTYLRREYGY